jgi:hypothetical protein
MNNADYIDLDLWLNQVPVWVKLSFRLGVASFLDGSPGVPHLGWHYSRSD